MSVAKTLIPGGKFQHLQANKIKFKKSFFDVIIIYSAIQYFPNFKYLKNVILKIKKNLKKDGILHMGEIIEKKN